MQNEINIGDAVCYNGGEPIGVIKRLGKEIIPFMKRHKYESDRTLIRYIILLEGGEELTINSLKLIRHMNPTEIVVWRNSQK